MLLEGTLLLLLLWLIDRLQGSDQLLLLLGLPAA